MARILIAEDEASVREFVSRALESANHDVTAVEDGIAALEALEKDEAGYDLLLTDIVMPRLDGIALALKVSKDYPGLAIILMTGFAAERQRAHNLEALVHEVVAKPFSLAQICKIVETTLGGGSV